jgi:hypothetical protein
MEELMPEDGLNQAERSMQSRFSLAVAAGCAAIIALVLVLAAQWRGEPNRFPLPPASVPLHFERLTIAADAASPLRIAGAWRLTADDPRFGGLSALAIDHGELLALSDSGVLARFASPSAGPAIVRIYEFPGGPGSPRFKVNRDSESLVRDATGRGWWVGFETRNQLRLFNPGFTRTLGTIDFGEDRWPENLGIEAMIAGTGDRLMLVPELAHEVVTVANGRARSEPLTGVGSKISDMARLPDGEMLVLLRDIGPTGFQISLGALVKRADGWRVERRVPLHLGLFGNFEGVAVERRGDGGTRLWLITDDNFQPPMTTMLVALDVPPGAWKGAN